MNCKDEVIKEKYINHTIHSYIPQILSFGQTVLDTISIVQNQGLDQPILNQSEKINCAIESFQHESKSLICVVESINISF